MPSSPYQLLYVRKLNGSRWTEQQEFSASDREIGDHFGRSVSVNGDVAVIEADYDDENGANFGAAYVFRFDGESETWVEEDKLLASDGGAEDFLGCVVAICREVAVIGHSVNRDREVRRTVVGQTNSSSSPQA